LNYLDKTKFLTDVPKMVPKINLCIGLSERP